MLIKSSEWVTRRVERVSFHDGRTASRQVTVDLIVPRVAPLFQVADDRHLALVPVAVLRKKTLANFTIARGNGQPMSLLSLRWNQALTRQMLLILGDAVDNGHAQDGQLKDLAREIAQGTQEEILHAKTVIETLEKGSRPASDALAWDMVHDVAIRELIYRFADSFLLLALLDHEGPTGQIIRFSYDEALSLKYKQSGDTHADDGNLPVFRPARDRASKLRSAYWARLGLLPFRIFFPTPAAENCQSYHFEVTAPPGTQISAASLLAGRPNAASERPSWDRVAGGFPVVGLHVCDVPNGSVSRAQVGLKLARRGWLTVNTAASFLCTGLLFTLAIFLPRPGQESSVVVVTTVGAAALTFVTRADEHDMVTRLVRILRAVAVLPLGLLILDATWIALHRNHLTRPPLLGFAVASLLCATVLAVACWKAKPDDNLISPWEQGFNVEERYRTNPSGNYEELSANLGFEEPAIIVGSAEGEHLGPLGWTKEAEADLVGRLLQLSYH